MKFECFYKITIEPTSGCTIWAVLKEMKSLSEITGLPVGAIFNNKQLLIKSDTNIEDVAQFYHNDIECNCVRRINR